MLVNKSYEILSCDDYELNVKRNSKLEYRISFDDERQMKAVVFIAGGFGANANVSFLDFDRQYLAKKFDVVVVDVFYHCFCARKSIDEKYNPKLVTNSSDLKEFNEFLKLLGEDFCVNENNFFEALDFVDKRLEILKNEGRADKAFKFNAKCDFVPPNGDYQNYGIMAALDFINALKDIMKKFPNFKTLPKIYGGGSYGGYLAFLIAKIAPFYVDCVVDNSGVVFPYMSHLLGRDVGAEFVFYGKNYDIFCFLKRLWNANNLSKENYIIRTILNTSHLQIQAKANADTIFISYHSSKDLAAPADDKIKLYELLKELGFFGILHLVKDENDVDKRFIKSLEHGLRMSDKALLKKELPFILERLKDKKIDLGGGEQNFIVYPCGEKNFIFYDDKELYKLRIEKS